MAMFRKSVLVTGRFSFNFLSDSCFLIQQIIISHFPGRINIRNDDFFKKLKKVVVQFCEKWRESAKKEGANAFFLLFLSVCAIINRYDPAAFSGKRSGGGSACRRGRMYEKRIVDIRS